MIITRRMISTVGILRDYFFVKISSALSFRYLISDIAIGFNLMQKSFDFTDIYDPNFLFMLV